MTIWIEGDEHGHYALTMHIEDSYREEWDFVGPSRFPYRRFGVSRLAPNPGSRAGLYAIFASNGAFSDNPSLRYVFLYVGQTRNMHSRFRDHELLGRWGEDASEEGLKRISAFLLFTDNWSKQKREQLEDSIIQRWNPISNKTHTGRIGFLS